ncbi:MAG TPA: hypothetical protein VFF20_10365 [Pseudogracilibacillus sp.]|nr:hypothetical protein [Pseudogracilibacillus sp.]
MTRIEKAKVILDNMEHYLQIDYAFEEYYLKGIMNGLREIERREEDE